MNRRNENAAADGYGLQESAAAGTLAWYVCLFSPADARPRVRALFAFRRELDKAANLIAEKDIARIRLGWWREEIARFAQAEPVHPVAKTLLGATGEPTLDTASLATMIDAAETELTQTRYPEITDLLAHCVRRGGSFLSLLCQISSTDGSPNMTSDQIKKIGGATSLVEMIRNLRRDLAQGQVFVPLEWMEQVHITVGDLNTDKPTAAALTVTKTLGERAEKDMENAATVVTQAPSAAVYTALYQRLHKAMKSNEYRDVFRERVELGGFQKLWCAWRAAAKGSGSA